MTAPETTNGAAPKHPESNLKISILAVFGDKAQPSVFN